MNSIWIAHLGKMPIEQEELKGMINASKPVLNRLIEIMERDLKLSLSEQKKVDHYNSPNWEYMQVDCNATQRTLEKLINLCKI